MLTGPADSLSYYNEYSIFIQKLANAVIIVYETNLAILHHVKGGSLLKNQKIL